MEWRVGDGQVEFLIGGSSEDAKVLDMEIK
jgi:hypothetical protein